MKRIWIACVLSLLALPAVAATELYYIHNDHLGTPRVITNQAQQVVWKGHGKPFGEVDVEIESITNHKRFPGQRFDIESRLHYNYFRDYDPAIGRYVQSDPIGLQGGLNTYAYVGGNPISNSDPTGEIAPLAAMAIGSLVGGGIDLTAQLFQNGANLQCVNWGEVGIAALASVAPAGRLGYKATIQGWAVAAKTMSKRGAFDMRAQIKRQYRLAEQANNYLRKRDKPFEQITDPHNSFARSHPGWDLVLTIPGATIVGGVAGAPNDCECP